MYTLHVSMYYCTSIVLIHWSLWFYYPTWRFLRWQPMRTVELQRIWSTLTVALKKLRMPYPMRRKCQWLDQFEIPNLNLQLAIVIPSCYNIGLVNMRRIGRIACIWSGWNALFVISGLGFVAISNKPKSPLCVASVFATFEASFMQAWWLLGFVKQVRGILYIIVSVSRIWLRLVSLKNCFLAKQLLCS